MSVLIWIQTLDAFDNVPDFFLKMLIFKRVSRRQSMQRVKVPISTVSTAADDKFCIFLDFQGKQA